MEWDEYLKETGVKPVKSKARAPKSPRREPIEITQPLKATQIQKAHGLPELKKDILVGIDGNRAKKLKSGKLPLEARLDLHGFSREQARDAFIRFIEKAFEQKKRCVLVITGKGSLENNGGVLRNLLETWMNMPQTRPLILACATARQEDGGTGAAYIYLKKQQVSHEQASFDRVN